MYQGPTDVSQTDPRQYIMHSHQRVLEINAKPGLPARDVCNTAVRSRHSAPAGLLHNALANRLVRLEHDQFAFVT
jgi:hypothetical protein